MSQPRYGQKHWQNGLPIFGLLRFDSKPIANARAGFFKRDFSRIQQINRGITFRASTRNR